MDTLNAADDPDVAIGALEMLPEGVTGSELANLDFVRVRVSPDDADLRTLDRASMLTIGARSTKAERNHGTTGDGFSHGPQLYWHCYGSGADGPCAG